MQFASWYGANGVDSYQFSITGGSVTYRPKNTSGSTINYVQQVTSTPYVMSSGVFTANANEVSITYCYGSHFPTDGLNSLLVALYE